MTRVAVRMILSLALGSLASVVSGFITYFTLVWVLPTPQGRDLGYGILAVGIPYCVAIVMGGAVFVVTLTMPFKDSTDRQQPVEQ